MRYLLPVVYLLMTSLAARATNWYVQGGRPLQPIINEAVAGDTIMLQAGATFSATSLCGLNRNFADYNSKFDDEFAAWGRPARKPVIYAIYGEIDVAEWSSGAERGKRRPRLLNSWVWSYPIRREFIPGMSFNLGPARNFDR